MKRLRSAICVTVLTLMISSVALAGDISTPKALARGDISTPKATLAPGDISTPKALIGILLLVLSAVN